MLARVPAPGCALLTGMIVMIGVGQTSNLKPKPRNSAHRHAAASNLLRL